ncbi:membrane transporter [Colletotrichum musicola]|uniref:Membrane transporter n=1 Tax=Colletotrichum musicola TaxID=2175873 RepID=A0A8H6J8Z2_9PEZI|nr:membrane transporter [Colletotrichum musicola]
METSGISKRTTGSASPSDEQLDPAPHDDPRNVGKGGDIENGFGETHHGIDTRAIHVGTDYVYEKKVSIMNQALIDIGMGPFQWKVFAMTGFGWFVDNFWMQAITIISAPVRNEFAVERIAFLTVAKYVGLVIGSTAWPISADFIGRKLAFNVTLLISAVSGLVGAGSPNFVAVAAFCAFIGLGTGGNQPVDSAIFLEFIPATHQYLLVVQSAFWSFGQAIAALIAWPLIANYSCPSGLPRGECRYEDNLGWRYTYWAFGGLTLVMYLLRLLFRVYETPKYLLGRGLDREAVEVVQKIAARNEGTTWLTLEHFQAVDAELGVSNNTGDRSTAVATTDRQGVFRRRIENFKPEKMLTLFSSPRFALSTCMVLFVWCSVGMAFPLYNSFIPIFLENKGASQGGASLSITYRNYAIQAVCGIPASLLGGFTVDMRRIGRKGTGTFACIGTGVFLFLFTRATTPAGVTGFTCAVAFFQNLVYGILYSYTPELFPAPVRGSANGLVALFNRMGGLMAPIIAAYIGIDTDLPVWISAGLFIVAGLVFFCLPYETRGRAAA